MPWKAVPDGVQVSVRLTPNAKKSVIEGVEMLADGRAVLKARVHAVPEKGHANTALIALLAAEIAVPRSHITLTSGATSRLKGVTIAGDTEQLLVRLKNLYQ